VSRDLGEQVALELEVLGRGLDHQLGAGQGGEVRRTLQRAEVLAPQAALLDAALDPPARGLEAALERLRVRIREQAAGAGLRGQLGDARAHRPRPEYADDHRCEYYAIDPFTVIFGGTLGFFIVFVLLLGMFSKRSAIDILDWKPTRSPEVEAQNDIDDVQQMIDAQNAIRRRRGLPDRDEEEIAASVERHLQELREQARRYRSGEG